MYMYALVFFIYTHTCIHAHLYIHVRTYSIKSRQMYIHVHVDTSNFVLHVRLMQLVKEIHVTTCTMYMYMPAKDVYTYMCKYICNI